jgi:hypothetical protein
MVMRCEFLRRLDEIPGKIFCLAKVRTVTFESGSALPCDRFVNRSTAGSASSAGECQGVPISCQIGIEQGLYKYPQHGLSFPG